MDVAIHCRYAEDVNLSFPKEIMALPGGEDLSKCIQCGTCSAGCPLSVYMDYTPRRIISLTRSGLEKDVLKAFTPWLCASCYECQVLCPKEIKITDIMYALKRRAIKKGSYPKRFPVPVLAREFFNIVAKNGRNSETWVVMKLMMKTNPFKLLGMAPQGLKMMKTGRLPLGQEKIKDRRQLQKMLDRVGEA